MTALPDFDDFMDDNLAVYHAALGYKNQRTNCEEIQRRRKARERARIAARRRRIRCLTVILVAVLALATVLGACTVAGRGAEDKQPANPVYSEPVDTGAILELCTTPPVLVIQEEPVATTSPMDFDDMVMAYLANPAGEPEIEEALLAHTFLSIAVPCSYELQAYMRIYCAEYGCPYPLALAVAEIESHFNMEAVGAAGEVGIMQLNPGPGGSYHAEIEAATGLDPTTPAGNIAGGCYKLGEYMAMFQGDVNKAAMAYNMGLTGARNAWANGVTSTDYSKKVLEAVENWECTVNAWGGV